MTAELMQAREFLRRSQGQLAAVRKFPFSNRNFQRDCEKDAEERVLAALSWVWDAQCRAEIEAFSRKAYYFGVSGIEVGKGFRAEQQRDWSVAKDLRVHEGNPISYRDRPRA